MVTSSHVSSILALLALSGTAMAATVPFTEHFASSASSWRDAAGAVDLAWVPVGGPDASSYASGTFNFQASVVNDTPVLFRGQNNYNSSGGAFVGNWITDGVTLVTAQVRHNAPVPLNFFGRFASPFGFPGAVAVDFVPVAPGQWQTITFAINPASPQFISFETSDFNTVFSNIGRVQFGVSVPAAMAGVNQSFTFDVDQVSIVPAPGALALLGLGMLARRRRR